MSSLELYRQDSQAWRIRQREYQLSLLKFGIDFFETITGVPYVHGRHIEVMANHLQALGRREISRLLMNLPPSSSKSTWVNVIFPAWVWTFKPKAVFLAFAHSSDIRERDLPACNTLVKSPEYQHYFPSVAVKFRDDSKSRFSLESGGAIISKETGGKATGVHPDYILIDDPYDTNSAERSVVREKIRKWYFDQLLSRGILRDVAHCVFHQHMHWQDLAGSIKDDSERQIAEFGESDWHMVELPMEFDPEHAMQDRGFGGDWRTEAGQLLWPEMLGSEAVSKLKRQHSMHVWKIQFNQKRVKRKGELFDPEKLQVVGPSNPLPPLEDFSEFVRAWDRAATDDGGCYTAGVLMGRYELGNRSYFYILDVIREQLRWDAVETLIEKTVVIDEDKYGLDRMRTYFEREGGSAGKQVAEAFVERMMGHNLFFLSPKGSKGSRAQPFATAINERHAVYIVVGDYYGAYIDELSQFSLTKDSGFKDQVDASAMAFLELTNPTHGINRGLVIAPPASKDEAEMPPMGEMGKCASQACKRPAFAGKYCCECCEKAAKEGMVEFLHLPRCNGMYSDWWARSKNSR